MSDQQQGCSCTSLLVLAGILSGAGYGAVTGFPSGVGWGMLLLLGGALGGFLIAAALVVGLLGGFLLVERVRSWWGSREAP